MAIQPIEYINANHLKFAEGCVVKYVSRHQSKKWQRRYTKGNSKSRVYLTKRL
jgi:hypothetical protein